MYFHEYDSSYDPSLPVVEISVGALRDGPFTTLTALVDSGADATAIPLRYLDQIAALPVERRWLSGVTGERHLVSLYEVYLRIGEFGQYLAVVGDAFGQEATVGRDILNHYVVKLDGPALVVEIHP
ncbi:MAG: hypothetical protein R3A44_00505 [Caldilineaceae bacterium]